MNAVSQRLHQLLHHPATVPIVLLLLVTTAVDLDRFPHWDESVFMSQTAGRDGVEVPPAQLGPSREIGSVWKIGILTSLTANYPNLRLLHILLTIVVVAFAAWSIARATGMPRTVVGLILGTYWITFVHIGQLLRFVILGFVLLAAMAVSARVLLATDRPSLPRVVGVAALFVVGLVLGPFETGLILVSTSAYWLAVHPVRRNPVPVLAFTGTVVLGSLVVLVLDTLPRYGSVSGRIQAMRDLSGHMVTSTFNWALLDDYFGVAIQGPVSNEIWAPEGALTRVAYALAAMTMLLGLFAIVRWLVLVATGRSVDHFTGLCSISFLMLMLFLAGYYENMSDRYFILPGSLLLLLGLMVLRDVVPAVVAHLTTDDALRRLAQLTLVYVGLIAFIIPNVAAARGLDDNWSGDGIGAAMLTLVRDLADGETCTGFARYNTPSLQWATGCHMHLATTLEKALTVADEVDDTGLTFVYWRTGNIAPEVQQQLDDEGWSGLVQYPDDEVPSNQIWIRD